MLSSRTAQLVNGFTLFYNDDVHLMTSVQVMAVRPQPELISYQ